MVNFSICTQMLCLHKLGEILYQNIPSTHIYHMLYIFVYEDHKNANYKNNL